MKRHVIRPDRQGWRCSCGKWLQVLDDAERHAFTMRGSIEPAGTR